MNGTLERLAKDSLEKDTQIKHQSELIIGLMKKLEKWPFQSSAKDLDGEESDKESNQKEDSGDEHIKKKESLLGLVSVAQIQSLIINAVMAQLGGGSHKTIVHKALYEKDWCPSYAPWLPTP